MDASKGEERVPAHALETDCRSVHARLVDDDCDLILLDCRERDEFELVHVPQSTLVPMSEIATRVRELEEYREREIAVICHHGMRSLEVTIWLNQQGFANVKSVAGGIDRWAHQIDPAMARY